MAPTILALTCHVFRHLIEFYFEIFQREVGWDSSKLDRVYPFGKKIERVLKQAIKAHSKVDAALAVNPINLFNRGIVSDNGGIAFAEFGDILIGKFLDKSSQSTYTPFHVQEMHGILNKFVARGGVQWKLPLSSKFEGDLVEALNKILDDVHVYMVKIYLY